MEDLGVAPPRMGLNQMSPEVFSNPKDYEYNPSLQFYSCFYVTGQDSNVLQILS